MAAALVDKALKKLTDINAVDHDGSTLLHIICDISDPNDVAACTRILAPEFGYRTSIDATDRDGDTAFLVAAGNGNLPVMKCLAEAKADVNAVNDLGESALHLVCQSNRGQVVHVIRWLAAQESGFDMQRFIEERSSNGYTPFFWAARACNLAALKVLASDCKANVNALSTRGWSALHVLCFWALRGAVPAIRWLASEESGFNVQRFIEHKDDLGCTPFLLSYYGGSRGPCIMKLLAEDLKANVNAVAKNNDSALHAVCREGIMPGLRWLLAKDSPFDVKRFIEAKGETGRTPFLFAAAGHNLYAMKLLANDHKANVNAVDNEKCSALHLGIESSSILAWLAAKESGFNFYDFLDGSEGCTPLEWAAFYPELEGIRVLVRSYKANVHHVNEHNRTILHELFDLNEF